MDNVSLGPNTETNLKSSEGKVMEQLRRFELKPSIARKPTVSVAGGQSVVSNAQTHQRNVSKPKEQSEQNYEPAWDVRPGKNVERLKVMGADRSSALVITPSSAQGAGRHSAGSKVGTSAAFSPPKSQALRPSEQPPPPPSKPPRTFAHDDYRHVKGQGPSAADTQSQSAQVVNQRKQARGEGHGVSTVKERISLLTDGSGDKEEVTLRSGNMDSYSRLGQKEEDRPVKGLRESPPSRPPPPRPRPISEGSALRKRHDASPDRNSDRNDSENDGPIVISLKHGKRIGRQVSVSGPHHRNPCDRLPDTPERGDSLQRFPLRKSFSSECLYTGSMSSLSDLGVDEDPSQGSMMRSYHARDSGEPLYEALIDKEGYAVPHKFLRIQLDQDMQHSQVRITFLRTST